MTTHTTATTGSTLAAYEARILAQIKDADARIEGFEAKAREKRLQAETTAVAALKVARQNLEEKLRALTTMSDAHIARAKRDIDAAAVALKNGLDEFGRQLAAISGKQ